MQNQNRSLKEDEYIDLGNIGADNNNKEQERHWAYRLIKQGAIKTMKINSNELINFLNIAKSTIGAFQVQVDDNKSKHYFVISIAFRP